MSATFATDGYAVIRGAVDAAGCRRMVEAIDELDRRHLVRLDSGEMRRYHRVDEQYPDTAASVFDRVDLAEYARAAYGGSGAVRRVRASAYRVPAGNRGEAAKWHQDRRPLHDDRVLAVMYYATAVRSDEQGATRVLPGSMGDDRVAPGARDRRKLILVEPGDALVMHGWLWHAGAAVAPGQPDRYTFQAFYTAEA